MKPISAIALPVLLLWVSAVWGQAPSVSNNPEIMTPPAQQNGAPIRVEDQGGVRPYVHRPHVFVPRNVEPYVVRPLVVQPYIYSPQVVRPYFFGYRPNPTTPK
jgi:hypothetical protein